MSKNAFATMAAVGMTAAAFAQKPKTPESRRNRTLVAAAAKKTKEK